MTFPKFKLLFLPVDSEPYDCPQCRGLTRGTTGYCQQCGARLFPVDCYESYLTSGLKTKLADIGTALEAVQRSLKDIQQHLEKKL